jgi:hypothetical protein
MNERQCGRRSTALPFGKFIAPEPDTCPRRPTHRRERALGRCRVRAKFLAPEFTLKEPKIVPQPTPANHTDPVIVLPRRLSPIMREVWRRFDAWATDQSMDEIMDMLSLFVVRPDSRN